MNPERVGEIPAPDGWDARLGGARPSGGYGNGGPGIRNGRSDAVPPPGPPPGVPHRGPVRPGARPVRPVIPPPTAFPHGLGNGSPLRGTPNGRPFGRPGYPGGRVGAPGPATRPTSGFRAGPGGAGIGPTGVGPGSWSSGPSPRPPVPAPPDHGSHGRGYRGGPGSTPVVETTQVVAPPPAARPSSAPDQRAPWPAEPVEGEAPPGRPGRRPGSTGGRRHHRVGGRPAAEFTSVAPSRNGRRGRRRRGSFWRELPMLVVVALVLTFLIQTFLARVYEIPSGSMETTLHGCSGCTNDRVLVDKLSYHFGAPAPGDVVVFAGPDNWKDSDFSERRSGNALVRGFQAVGSVIGFGPPDEKDLIKRVIAVGGQTVACCDAKNRVTVDGKSLNEPYVYYLPEAGPAKQAEFGPIRVPDGELWVMGDSRNNSADSRAPGHGPIPVASVIGKARFVVLPLPRIQGIPDTNPQVRARSEPSN